jgi:hypothetical protein
MTITFELSAEEIKDLILEKLNSEHDIHEKTIQQIHGMPFDGIKVIVEPEKSKRTGPVERPF